jgi:hypothetical protein
MNLRNLKIFKPSEPPSQIEGYNVSKGEEIEFVRDKIFTEREMRGS